MKTKKLISWEVIDKYKTSRGIAAFLRKRKITGISGSQTKCPLAAATGYRITPWKRAKGWHSIGKRLTRAEKDFVTEFDLNVYPDLERK